MSRILALSDIHGFTAEARLLLEAAAYEPGRDRLFLLGDYIDYEPHTWSSLNDVMELASGGAVALAGNMERHLQRHLERELASRGSLDSASSAQLQFLQSLPLHAAEGGWLFVHAGIRPGLPLERQTEPDLIGIREEFWGAADAPPMQPSGLGRQAAQGCRRLMSCSATRRRTRSERRRESCGMAPASSASTPGPSTGCG
ncbi:metallophosphoesterase [Paenibacillus sp. P22]|uniref:metallophosphoesterase n=1 Tax=Paenibacillus sp. P22 TaxID=483908 RepID=UPI0006613AFF|nr:metallophosphoesterase [Paenibacillus sp. P22]